MTGQDISVAVRALIEARRSKKQFSPSFKLTDRAAVYAIQNEVARAFGPVDGWKVGAKTPTAEPNCAPLLAGSLVNSPARFDGRAMHMIGVEVEISFRIARDIPARAQAVGRDEALAAVGDAFVGMEVVDTRLADFKELDPEWLLADNQMNQALVMGATLGTGAPSTGRRCKCDLKSMMPWLSISAAGWGQSIRYGRLPG